MSEGVNTKRFENEGLRPTKFSGRAVSGNKLGVPKSGNNSKLSVGPLSTNSEGDDLEQSNKLIRFYRTISEAWSSFWHQLGVQLALSLPGMLLLPLLAMLLAAACVLAVFNSALVLELPSIAYYNALHILFFLVSELFVLTTFYALKQTVRFETAWKLAFGLTDLKSVEAAYRGNSGRLGKWVILAMVAFQGLSLGVTFVTKWEIEYTSIGSHECFEPTYTAERLRNFTVDPSVLEGTLAYAQVYSFGIIAQDGIISGFAPWPADKPADYFELTGPGPALAIQARCDSKPVDWNGTAPAGAACGGLVESIHENQRGFNANLVTYVKRTGYKDLPGSTPFVRQDCSLSAYLGKAIWNTHFLVDRWEKITQSAVDTLTVGNETVYHHDANLDFYIGKYTTLFLDQEEDGYDFSSINSEGSVLIESIMRALIDTFDNQWYPAGMKGDVCDLLSWSTDTTNYFRSENMDRGMNAAMAAIAVQVFSHFDRKETSMCTFDGDTGAGRMHLNAALVYAIDAIVAVVVLVCAMQVIFAYVLHPIPDHDHFRSAAKNVMFEGPRSMFTSQWISSLFKKYNGKGDRGSESDPLLHAMLNTQVRYGEQRTKNSLAKETYWIGPKADTLRFKSKKSVKQAAALEDGDDDDEIDLQKILVSGPGPTYATEKLKSNLLSAGDQDISDHSSREDLKNSAIVSSRPLDASESGDLALSIPRMPRRLSFVAPPSIRDEVEEAESKDRF